MVSANITIEEIAARLKAAPAVLIYCHARPDGDTIGSAMALAAALAGKPVEVVTADTIPHYIRFLTGGKTDLSLSRLSPDFLATPDLLHVAVDVADAPLLGAYAPYAERIDIRIDHHIPRNGGFGKHYYIDPEAPACGQIIYHIIVAMNALDRRTAKPLYAAISSDTGCFRYANTNAESHTIAAALMHTGISAHRINHMLYENATQAELRAKKLALSRLSYLKNGEIALISISAADKAEADVTDLDLGDISSLPRNIDGVKLGITIRQLEDGNNYKISMRADADTDASALCALFGGGGHRGAAGAMVQADSIETACAIVCQAVLAELDHEN